MSSFYVTNSIVLVLEASPAHRGIAHFASVLLYLVMYVYIITAASGQLWAVSGQTRHLGPDMAEAFTKPLLFKREMFAAFTLLVVLSLASEAASQYLSIVGGRLEVVLLCYEVSNAVLMGAVGYYFLPVEYSPFFFMIPVVDVTEAASERLLTIIKTSEDEDVNGEIATSLMFVPDDGLADRPSNEAHTDIAGMLRAHGIFTE